MITIKQHKNITKEFKDLYKISFPKDERLPNSFLSNLIKKEIGQLDQYYDDGSFIGFTYSVIFNNFTCLAFFATDPNFRNRGYGKIILDLYAAKNEKQIIFLNCEVPENDDKDNIKFRRMSFYKRNGYVVVPIIMTYQNIEYLTLVNKEINEKDIIKLNKILIASGCDCKIEETYIIF